MQRGMATAPAPPTAAAAPAARRRSGPRSRSSIYKGVTAYKKTGRWEAHVWLPCARGKGRQRHLGSYATAEDAARAFDRATLRVRGLTSGAETNFAAAEYVGDAFLDAFLSLDKDRFMDQLKATFALKTSPAVAAAGGAGAGGRASGGGMRRRSAIQRAAAPLAPRAQAPYFAGLFPAAAAPRFAAAPAAPPPGEDELMIPGSPSTPAAAAVLAWPPAHAAAAAEAAAAWRAEAAAAAALPVLAGAPATRAEGGLEALGLGLGLGLGGDLDDGMDLESLLLGSTCAFP